MLAGLTIEEKLFINRLAERLERVRYGYHEEITDFLAPREQALAEEFLHSQGYFQYAFCGGYTEAERKQLAILPDYASLDCTTAGIVLVKLQGKMDFVQVNHRDYLGAVLGLGIRREKIGDLIVVYDGCYILTTASIADYLLMNEIKVKGIKMSGQVVALEDWQPPELKTEAVQIMVASMRIDTIVAHGFGLSRSKSLEFIKSGKVQVNHREVTDSDYQCQQCDIISFRGKGKLKVNSIDGQTKKGKIKIGLLKYI